MPIRIAIVEDDHFIRKELEEIVSTDSDLILAGSYSNAEELEKNFMKLSVDVVLQDINLPGKSGIESVRHCRQLKPDVQFIMCTVFENNENIFESLCAGATGYLVKSSSPEKIREAIHEVHRGGSPMSPHIARLVVTNFPLMRSSRGHVSKEYEMLTDREKEIVDLLSRGFQYKEIASQLFVHIETIRSHIRHIYVKLQVNTRTEALNKVYPRK